MQEEKFAHERLLICKRCEGQFHRVCAHTNETCLHSESCESPTHAKHNGRVHRTGTWQAGSRSDQGRRLSKQPFALHTDLMPNKDNESLRLDQQTLETLDTLRDVVLGHYWKLHLINVPRFCFNTHG